jgi:uncharacterized protein (TIGR03663 family)
MTFASSDLTETQSRAKNPGFWPNAQKWEWIIFSIILILAFLSRFYILGLRVMSHDETSHVYFSWLLEQGRGYRHDPITHGPLQFHLIALSYFILGDNDFSARLPAALFSIATIAFMWKYRQLFGKAGSLIAAFLLLISPYILYYGRYARNEALVGLFGVLLWWGIINYLQSKNPSYLIWVTLATVLHFTAKETAFIYTAQALIFLAFMLIYQVSRKPWQIVSHQRTFFIFVILAILLITIAGVIYQIEKPSQPTINAPTETETQTPSTPSKLFTLIPIFLGILSLLGAMYFLLRGYTWEKLKEEPAFDLAILLTTFVLPMLAPFPVKFLGRNPIDYTDNENMIIVGAFVVLFSLLAIGLGLAWRQRIWMINFGVFYAIFILFYSTIFTNGFGIVTGLVGSLGYWLEQQGVNRGSQPWYYYAFVQIPMYEYLPAIGVIYAGIYAWWKTRKRSFANIEETPIHLPKTWSTTDPLNFIFFFYWSITSLIAFTIAGEKMPWLTFHIALPMILLTAWALGKTVESLNIKRLFKKKGWIFLISTPIFITSTIIAVYFLFSATPPFQGKELTQLQATSSFLSALLFAALSGYTSYTIMKKWAFTLMLKYVILTFFTLLAILTIHTSVLASYINYDNATEYLVYAHSARGPKDILEQIEEISRRTTGGLDIRVAYDNETTYPYWWYLRNYPNQLYYEQNPTRELRNYPIILVGELNYGKIEPVVGQAYYKFDYIRLWWPNQDYFDLTQQRISEALLNPQMRQAIFNIWLYRDYTLYGQITNKDMSLSNWYPSSRMRLYIKKDLVSSLWNYGSLPAEAAIQADPYEGKELKIEADKIIGSTGTEPGQFQHPRDLAVAVDGTLYIVDADNHRIQHLSPDGKVLQVWGSFADSTAGEAPGGTFNQPWGIALDSQGFVYVADTWNHRIQKFSPSGDFITMWGYFGQAEEPTAFWGPRDIAIDSQDRLFITDTGNKRIVVFDNQGNFITEFGTAGLQPGEFDEPVGVAISSDGQLFVADTWNQRVQAFALDDNLNFNFLTSWEIFGWFGQSLENKPYIAVNSDNHVFVTDPEAYRILEFSADGTFIRYWGDYSTGTDGFNLPASIAIDPTGGVWVTDAGNGRIMHFTLP